MSGIVGSRFNIRGSGLVGSLGTDGQVFTSSGAGKSAVFEAAAGGGKILQVTSTQVTGDTSNTSHTSYVASDLAGAITPTASSSHIVALINGRFHVYENSMSANGGARGRCQVHRDIGGAGYSAVFPATTDITAGISGMQSGAEGSSYHHLHYSFRDSPNTTSACTYKVYHRLDVASGHGQTSNIGGSSAHMSVVLMEIDGS